MADMISARFTIVAAIAATVLVALAALVFPAWLNYWNLLGLRL